MVMFFAWLFAVFLFQPLCALFAPIPHVPRNASTTPVGPETAAEESQLPKQVATPASNKYASVMPDDVVSPKLEQHDQKAEPCTTVAVVDGASEVKLS